MLGQERDLASKSGYFSISTTLKIYAADFVNNQRESRLSSLDPLYSTKESYNVLLALFLALVKTHVKIQL